MLWKPDIEYVMFDLDGCLSKGSKFSKDVPPDLRSEFDTMGRFLDFMRPISARRAAVTGRSLTISRVLIDLLMNDLSVCEHGTVLYDPREPNPRYLVDADGRFAELREARELLENFIGKAPSFQDELQEYCFKQGFAIRHLSDNFHILTYEVEPELEKNALTAAAYLESKIFPEAMNEHLRAGKIKRVISKVAVDYMPVVSKKAGAEAVIRTRGIDPASILAAGDSYHSDGPVMELVADAGGYVLCPGNSDERLKEFVQGQGRRGYVAAGLYFDGTMEGLARFFR